MGALNTLAADVRAIAAEAIKKNTSGSQLKADIIEDGLGESQANVLIEVYRLFC